MAVKQARPPSPDFAASTKEGIEKQLRSEGFSKIGISDQWSKVETHQPGDPDEVRSAEIYEDDQGFWANILDGVPAPESPISG